MGEPNVVSGSANAPQTAPATQAGSERNDAGKSKSVSGVSGKESAQKSVGASESPAGVTPPAPQQTEDPNIWKLKVNGEERTYDIRNPEHVKSLKLAAQKAQAADEMFRQSKVERQQAQQLVEAFKKDPEKVMRMLGQDPEQFSTQVLRRKLEMAQMSPDQRAIMERDAQIAAYKAQDEQRQQEAQAQQSERLDQEARVKYDKQITDALNTSGLPKTEFTVQRTANYLLQAKKMGYKDVTAADVIETVKADYMRDFQTMTGAMPIDQFEALVGKDFMKRLREEDIKRLNAPRETFAHRPSGQPSKRADTSNKGLSWNDYQKELERRVKS